MANHENVFKTSQSKHYDSFIKKYFPKMAGKKAWGYSHDYVAEWLLIENELYLNNP
jgi:hypothetical protein